METTAREAKPEAELGEASAGWSPSNVVKRVAEQLARADVRTIYGTPVERNGMTVIPVARVRYGFGGGAGRKRPGGEEGTGAGGGVNVTPVGFIEIRNDKARFRCIRTSSPMFTALGFAIAAWFLTRIVRRTTVFRR